MPFQRFAARQPPKVLARVSVMRVNGCAIPRRILITRFDLDFPYIIYHFSCAISDICGASTFESVTRPLDNVVTELDREKLRFSPRLFARAMTNGNWQMIYGKSKCCSWSFGTTFPRASLANDLHQHALNRVGLARNNSINRFSGSLDVYHQTVETII